MVILIFLVSCILFLALDIRLLGTSLNQILTTQHSLAVQVARAVGSPGSAVLIFVPGMASILAIVEHFEVISSTDVVYKVRATVCCRNERMGGACVEQKACIKRVTLLNHPYMLSSSS